MKSPEQRSVNLGNPVELTVHEVGDLVLKISGSASQIVHRPLPEDDPKHRCPGISRAREVLSWEPRVSAEEGLWHTIEWFARRQTSQQTG